MVPRVQHLHWPDGEKIADICGVVAARTGVAADNVRVVKSPYRICPLGAHVDHQGGLVSAAAVDFGIVLAFVPTDDGAVHVTSDSFAGHVSFSVSDIPPVMKHATPDEPGCWGNFPRGAAFALQQGHRLQRGINAHLWSPRGLDSGGISSSAAVGVAYLLALEEANGLQVTQEENVELDRLIENEYLGLKNGILDQSAILMSRSGPLTVIDCRVRKFKHVAPPWLDQAQAAAAGGSPGGHPFKVLLAFSGVRAALAAGSNFNTRVTECHAAAAQLSAAVERSSGGAAAGQAAAEGKGAPLLLGQFTHAQWEAHAHELDDMSQRRARHFFGETRRVAEGVEAWRAGDLRAFGQLMKQSGLSSIHNYEVGTEHLKHLQTLLHQADGVYGARFSGAGTRGACVALVQPQRAEEVAREVHDAYVARFPDMAGVAQVILSDCGEGAHVVR